MNLLYNEYNNKKKNMSNLITERERISICQYKEQ